MSLRVMKLGTKRSQSWLKPRLDDIFRLSRAVHRASILQYGRRSTALTTPSTIESNRIESNQIECRYVANLIFGEDKSNVILMKH